MAQQLQNITVKAPGFAGINTQDSPIGLDTSFAKEADNCIIDQFGRIGARKGTVSSVLQTATFTGDNSTTDFAYPSHIASASDLTVTVDGVATTAFTVSATGNTGNVQFTTAPAQDAVIRIATTNKNIDFIFEGTDKAGNVSIVASDTSGLYTADSGYTQQGSLAGGNWKAVNFNDKTYLFKRGQNPVAYDISAPSFTEITGTDVPKANEAIAAYGRLWAVDTNDDNHTIHWSDLLIGDAWDTQDTNSSAGTINLSTVFPNGHDEVVALAAHNDFLFILCKKCIIIYKGASDPTTMSLQDTVIGVGCTARDSVQNTGTDVIFLSDTGLRSMGRVVQEKSLPMRDISKNVRTDLLNDVIGHATNISSVYSAKEAFYLLFLPELNKTYCFDMRTALEDGSQRVTTWSGIKIKDGFVRRNQDIILATDKGLFKYTGFLDNGVPYNLRYFTNPMDFGSPSNLKFLRKFNLTVIGNASATTTLNWAYDYSKNFDISVFQNDVEQSPVAEYTDSGTASEYIESEYGISVDIHQPTVNASGSGTVATVGIETLINDASYSIQQMDIHALTGRLI
tara:strand:- start:1027 stop:2727 length:1701 start_codon:yes stop_codon:yes gene_type:complete